MATSTPVFIIAQQRSGTNLLRRSLATTGVFRDSDEIFDPRRKGYWPYYQEQIEKQPELGLPTSDNQMELFESFLESHLNHDARFTLLDVKYNSTHLQDGVWHSPVARPAFVNWLIQKQLPVIHLVRENCLENYVSFLVGTHTQDWVVRANADRPKPIKLELDAHLAVFQIKRRQQLIGRFRNNLANANSIELCYESLIDDSGEFSHGVLEKICKFLKIQDSLLVDVPTKKTGRPLREIVVNYDSEVAPMLKANGLGEYLELEVGEVSSQQSQAEKAVVDASQVGPSEPNVDELSDGNSFVKVRPFHILKYVPRVELPELRSKPAFVFSLQQSGSEMLRASLSGSKHFGDLGEVFCPGKDSFWEFRQKMLTERPEVSVRTPANQLEIWETYLSERLHGETPFTLIDAKYNSTQNLNEAWYHRGARPLLLDWLVEKQYPVIHLVRQNIPASFLAQWINQNDSEGSLRIDPNLLLQHLKFQQTQIDVFRQWMDPINSVEVCYESLLEQKENGGAGEVSKVAGQFQIKGEIDISLNGVNPLLFPSHRIENFESEIIPALIAHGYEKWSDSKWFVDGGNLTLAKSQAA